METWRGIHPSVLSKEEQRGRRCRFNHRFSSRHIFRVAQGFLPEFPKTPPKSVLCNFFLPTFFTKIITTFFGVTSKNGHVFFCKPWALFFEVKQRWAPFLRGLSGMLPRFSANQNFWVCACIPSPPTPAPLLFITASQVISWFIKIDLKHADCSFSSTQKIQNAFL